MINFEITQTTKKSRLGVLKIKDIEILTPCFIPETTGLDVPAMFADSVKSAGFNMIYADIYRSLMRLGLDAVHKHGGIAKMMGYDGLVMLGSGANQIADSQQAFKTKEDGTGFASYTDGSLHKLSPESSIRISKKYQGDIITGLYEVPKNAAGNRKNIGSAVRRTTRWTKRAMEVYASDFRETAKAGDTCFFASVIGGAEGDLRMQSAYQASLLNPDGFLQTKAYEGEPDKAWFTALAASMTKLPADKPAAVMGIKNIDDLKTAVALGIDMIIADFPMQDGLNGLVYYENDDGSITKIDLKDEVYFHNKNPIISGCNCPACLDFSLSYLHHLFTADELLGPRLAVWHNLCCMDRVMEDIRATIAKG